METLEHIAELAIKELPHCNNPVFTKTRHAFLQALQQMVQIIVLRLYADPEQEMVMWILFTMFNHDSEAFAAMMMCAVRTTIERMPIEYVGPILERLIKLGANPTYVYMVNQSLASAWLITRAKADEVSRLLALNTA